MGASDVCPQRTEKVPDSLDGPLGPKQLHQSPSSGTDGWADRTGCPNEREDSLACELGGHFIVLVWNLYGSQSHQQ